jgi:hypothetical protein
MPSFKNSSNVLLVTNGVEEGTEKEKLQSEVGSSGVISCLPFAQLQGDSAVNGHAASFDGVLSVSCEPHSEKSLAEISKRLKPGGTIVLREPILLSSPSDINKAKLRTDKQLFLALTVAGFVDVKHNTDYKSSSEQLNKAISFLCEKADYSRDFLDKNLSFVEFVATKPEWEIGTSAAIKLPLSKKKTVEEKKPEAKKPAVWTLAADEVDEAELEDENALLDDADFLAPTKKKKDDCEVGKGGQRKACKNCSCGRKEMESSSAPKTVPADTPKSSCGNCYLGDAFRCASCPYLGQPAFKPGEKVLLNLDSMDI